MKQPAAPKKNFIGDLLGDEPIADAYTAPQKPNEAADEPIVKLSTRLSRANFHRLQRVAYWLPGRGAKVQAVVNAALAAYFVTHPDAERPIPED